MITSVKINIDKAMLINKDNYYVKVNIDKAILTVKDTNRCTRLLVICMFPRYAQNNNIIYNAGVAV